MESTKSYLIKPTILVNPIEEKPLMVAIISLDQSPETPLTQENAESKENVLSYLNRMLVGPYKSYSLRALGGNLREQEENEGGGGGVEYGLLIINLIKLLWFFMIKCKYCMHIDINKHK